MLTATGSFLGVSGAVIEAVGAELSLLNLVYLNNYKIDYSLLFVVDSSCDFLALGSPLRFIGHRRAAVRPTPASFAIRSCWNLSSPQLQNHLQA